MKRIIWILPVLACLLLGGCTDVMDGSYVSVEPHESQSGPAGDEIVSVTEYTQLRAALTDLVAEGLEEGVISVAEYSQGKLDGDMQRAVQDLLETDPVAAYAVGGITYDRGKSGGKPALAVKIRYTRDRLDILKIKQLQNNEELHKVIATALNQCEVEAVLRIAHYEPVDFVQVVETYALEHPDRVMEQPRVSVNVYPQTGRDRVVELRFSYQTSRESLKNMQSQVQPVFTSASLYVSGDASDTEKYSQLYSFLMERYEYRVETSITPAYSLLRHGVGDSRAFATVYSAMCRQAGLNCLVVTGTRNGASHYWNILRDEGKYYHLDLLSGSFREMTDAEMIGYVWDYSAYPQSG